MYYEMPSPPPPPEKTGPEIWKVMRLQLGIFIGYQLLLAGIASGSRGSAFLFLDMLPLIVHWIVLFVFMCIKFGNRKTGAGLGYLISLLATMIIGFGSCFFISGIIDKGMVP